MPLRAKARTRSSCRTVPKAHLLDDGVAVLLLLRAAAGHLVPDLVLALLLWEVSLELDGPVGAKGTVEALQAGSGVVLAAVGEVVYFVATIHKFATLIVYDLGISTVGLFCALALPFIYTPFHFSRHCNNTRGLCHQVLFLWLYIFI